MRVWHGEDPRQPFLVESPTWKTPSEKRFPGTQWDLNLQCCMTADVLTSAMIKWPLSTQSIKC